jgi:hypothetical protein
VGCLYHRMIMMWKNEMRTKNKKENKVKKSKKSQSLNDVGYSKYYKCVQRIVSKKSNIEHWTFQEVDNDHKVDQFTIKGTRVLVASYPDFYKIFVYKTHVSGEQSWPNGGVTVYNATYEIMQSFYYDSVAIHPDGGSYKFQT